MAKMHIDQETERLAKAMCRSLLNERDSNSMIGSVEQAMQGVAYAIKQGWIDSSMQLTEAGRVVATKSRAGKFRSRTATVFT